jgi:RNA polymerase sigma factor (sigma-70 family)
MASQTLTAVPPRPRRRRPTHLTPVPDGAPATNPDQGELSLGAEALLAYQQGQPEALTTLMACFTPTMNSVARRYLSCSQDVEDAVQDAWVSFARSAQRIQTPRAIGAWLCTTTSRSALSIAQRQTRCRPSETPLDGRVAAVDSSHLECLDETRAVRDAVSRLSGPERELVGLLFVDEMPYTEIAASTGRSIGGIGPTRQRIIAKLRHDRAIGRQLAARSA